MLRFKNKSKKTGIQNSCRDVGFNKLLYISTCYKRLFDEMGGKDVPIRTLDLGGDKLLAYSDTEGETNPDLGLRAIRFSFRQRDIFHQQTTFGDHA